MGKRYSAILLAAALTLSILPVRAWAVQPDPMVEAASISSSSDALGNDELFAGYVEQTFYTDRYEAMLARYGETVLSGANLQVYNRLRTEIAKVANGSLNSSVFEIDISDLGVTYSGGSLQGVNTRAILDALLADLPYELYWFDKTTGGEISYSYGYTRVVTSITFKLPVSQDYALDTSDGKRYYTYKPDTVKTGAAAAAAKNAQALVNRCGGMSDYDKLTAYRDYIVEQVDYNNTAAAHNDYPYGDPWQLIYVFDNDPSTDVVCEGYAKAFKYLCDISSFSNDIACYTVSGYTSGAHMWNIVRINGQSYMADITNCDTDRANVKPLDALFLAGDPNGTANSYTIHVPRYEIGGGRYVSARDIHYTYGDDTKRLYSASVLTLAASNYTPSANTSPNPNPSTSQTPDPCAKFTDLLPNAYYLDAVNWAVSNNITIGTTDTTFSPGKTCTHAEILTFLWRAAGKPASNAQAPIPMTGNEFYSQAARWAAEKGMIGSNFSPDTPCTRLYAVYYIWQAFEKPESSGKNPFYDVPMDWVGTEAVLWATDTGVTTGTTSTAFSPNKICSRSEIITFLHRAYT